MSEAPNVSEVADEVDQLSLDANYKPPPQKTINEILEADKEDESLRRYKEALLGSAAGGANVIVGNIKMHKNNYLESIVRTRHHMKPNHIISFLRAQ